MSVTLKDEKLLDSWGVVIDNAAGNQDQLLARITANLQHGELPGVGWKMVEASPSMFKQLLGKKRQYLMVTSQALTDYRMYVGARDYGRHLDVSWFLTVEPGFFKKAFSGMMTQGANPMALSFMLDLFDQQDLRAYVTAVHRCCVRQAVESLIDELGQDRTRFDWKSKGFLAVW